MIDEKKLVKEIKNQLIKEIKNRRDFWLSKASKYAEMTDEWIPCSESMPEEHEEQQPIIDPVTLAEIDVRYYMASDLVQVTVESGTGRRFVCDDCKVNGRWSNFNEDLGFEVLAWQPLPEPWKGEEK